MNLTIFNDLYQLVNQYFFGGATELSSNADLICNLIASFGSIFLIALPFIVVWKVIKLIVG